VTKVLISLISVRFGLRCELAVKKPDLILLNFLLMGFKKLINKKLKIL